MFYLKTGSMYVSCYDLDDPEDTLILAARQDDAVPFEDKDTANDVRKDFLDKFGVDLRLVKVTKAVRH